MLEKLSAFQEKESEGWLARIIQAAVASRCSQLRIEDLQCFRFEPKPSWTVEEVEKALLDPALQVSRSLEHLRRGLWAAAWSGERGFELDLRNQAQGLQCLQGKLTRRPSRSETTVLKLGPLENSDTGYWREHLVRYSHCSPIPIRGPKWEELDALEACSEEVIAVGGTANGDLPRLVVPRSTARGKPLNCYFEPEPAVLWVLAKKEKACLFWLDDGVIVDRDELWNLNGAGELGVRAYASADGLPRDLSGYSLVEGEERARRRGLVLRCLAPHLMRLQPLVYSRSVEPVPPAACALATAGLTGALGWLLGDPALGVLVSLFTGGLAAALASTSGSQAASAIEPEWQRNQQELDKLKSALRKTPT